MPASDLPCQASFAFRSVIVEGPARLLEDPKDKIMVLNALMEKYQPGARLRSFTEQMVRNVGIVEIVVEKMTGKQSRPPGAKR